VQGVAYRKVKVLELKHVVTMRAPGEEDTAIARVADAPVATAREEREGEVGGFRDAGGLLSGAPRRLRWVE
jgi:hypothetical protein